MLASAAVIAGLCIGLPVCRLDAYTFVIITVAYFVLLFPDLYSLIARVRMLKAGGVELHLDPASDLNALKQETASAENSLEGKSDYFGFPPISETSPEAKRLLDKGEPKAAFLALAQETETRLRELAAMNSLPPKLPLRSMLDQLIRLELLPREVIDLFVHVRHVRNSVLHEPGYQLTATQLQELVQVAKRLHHMVHYIPC